MTSSAPNFPPVQPPPVWFLLRGLSRESRHWFGFEQTLSHALEVPVHTLDLPGTGDHLEATCPTTVRGIARFLDDVVQRQRYPVGLLGISLGGMVALECAHLWGSRVSHVVTLNASSRLSPSFARMRPGALLLLLRAFGERDVVRREELVYQITVNAGASTRRGFADRGARVARSAPVSRQNAVRQLLAAARYYPERPGARCLTLASAGDRIVSPVCSAHLSAFLGSPFFTHPTAGHDLGVEDPEWVTRRVHRWLTAPSVDDQIFLQKAPLDGDQARDVFREPC